MGPSLAAAPNHLVYVTLLTKREETRAEVCGPVGQILGFASTPTTVSVLHIELVRRCHDSPYLHTSGGTLRSTGGFMGQESFL